MLIYEFSVRAEPLDILVNNCNSCIRVLCKGRMQLWYLSSSISLLELIDTLISFYLFSGIVNNV